MELNKPKEETYLMKLLQEMQKCSLKLCFKDMRVLLALESETFFSTSLL